MEKFSPLIIFWGYAREYQSSTLFIFADYEKYFNSVNQKNMEYLVRKTLVKIILKSWKKQESDIMLKNINLIQNGYRKQYEAGNSSLPMLLIAFLEIIFCKSIYKLNISGEHFNHIPKVV